MWNQTSRVCVNKPPADERDLWATLIPPETEVERGQPRLCERTLQTETALSILSIV